MQFRICIYSGSERRELWKDLNLYNRIAKGHPWVIMGDFNVTLKVEEHSMGGSLITQDMQEFSDCVNSIEVEDISHSGLVFTWIKFPKNPITSTLKKLDKIMANEDFLANFPAATSKFHPFMVSDHSHAVITIPNALKKKKNKSFRFAKYIEDKK